MNKISNTPINRILEKDVHGKTISVYFFLAALAEEGQCGEAVIREINPHRIYTLMTDKHIPISYRQLCLSLQELEEKGLIEYPVTDYQCVPYQRDQSTIYLVDACVDFIKSDTYHQSKGFVSIPEIVLSNVFYRLSVRVKRMFLYVYKHFLISKDFFQNILKPDTYRELCRILKVNRPQKIRDIIEELHRLSLLKCSCLRNTMRDEVYRFTIGDIVENSKLDGDSNYSVVNPVMRKTLIKRIVHWFKGYGYQWNDFELHQIIKTMVLWKWRDICEILKAYVRARAQKGVEHIPQFLKKLRYEAI